MLHQDRLSFASFLAYFVAISGLLALAGVRSAQAVECGECDRASMCGPPPTNCPGELGLDNCDCCLVCARMENETCQGPFGQFGRCAEDLVCMTSPKPGEAISKHAEGICKPQGQPPPPANCDRSQCHVVFVPECPPDSKVVRFTPPPGQCCPDPPTCQCTECLNIDPVCPEGQLKVKAVDGQGVPGQCCDVFECQDRDVVCGDVVCPEDRFANLSCPADSRLLPRMRTHNGCCSQQRCECEHVFECAPVICADTQYPNRTHRATGLPGDCCDVWTCQNTTSTVCVHGDNEYENGESWMIDACTRTTCKEGILFLEDLSAGCEVPTNCGIMHKPEGQCCLECKGCMGDNGKVIEDGATWQQDDCLQCRCDGGQLHCVVEDCFNPCPYALKVPGQCCPVCPSNATVLPPQCPSLRGCQLDCSSSGFMEDQYGCPLCRCKPREVIEQCVKTCPLGYRSDEAGRELCECIPPEEECPRLVNCTKLDCIYGYRRDNNGCPKCKCRRCSQLQHCTKRCPLGYVYNHHGCKICKCRGSEAPPITSTSTSTTTSPALSAVPPGGGGGKRRCLSGGGHMMEEGQSWHDGCRRCFCYQGREMCALITCPVASCRSPFIKMGDCCPSCTALEIFPLKTTSCTTQDGQLLREGETWELDRCTLCICHDGGMMCDVETCPPILCHQPYYRDRDSCCPICPEEGTIIPAGMPIGDVSHKPCMSNSGYTYSHKDTWKVSPCQSCVCRDGQIHCFAQTCPILPCERTTLVKGHCCPVCIESTHLKPHCVHNGEMYSEGELWFLDACSICVCLDGQKMCTEEKCPALPSDCPHEVTLPGLCCPHCTNSTLSSPIDVTELPGYHDDHGHGVYHVLIVALISIVAVLIFFLVLIILCFYCCPHWREKAAIFTRSSRDQNNSSKISHFTQTNGEVKKARPKSMNGDLKGVEAFLQGSQLQGITNTQMNEYTVLPGVLNSDVNEYNVLPGVLNGNVNEYSTIPAIPPSHNDYATLNGLHMQINEYTPLTREESESDTLTREESESGNPSHEKMWRYSSAEDRTNRVFLDVPDICDTAGNRKSL